MRAKARSFSLGMSAARWKAATVIPIRDENPTQRRPVVTWAILIALGVVWVLIQGAGMNPLALAQSVCDLGLVPGEITKRAALGTAVPIGDGLACIVDDLPINYLTPITSMFLHGGWGHLLGNALFLWIFGDNIEDSMTRPRFLVFYLVCGLAAAAAQTMVHPASAVPMVGASGAISGVLGGYLRLYPRIRVDVLIFLFIFIHVFTVPAWLMLVYWFALQLLSGLPQLSSIRPDVSAGVAFWAHIGGFAAGFLLVKFFTVREYVDRRRRGLPRGRWYT
jgi:membrane associated rhomboid family serine protease